MIMLMMLVVAAVTASAERYTGYIRGGYYITADDDFDCGTSDGKPTEAFITIVDEKYKFSKIFEFQKREDMFKVMKQINNYVSFNSIEMILDNEELNESEFSYSGLFVETYYVPSIE